MTICFYHKNCLDGLASAAVVKRAIPTTQVQAVQYGHDRPSVIGQDLILVDFGFPLKEMQALKREAQTLTWIDHHVTSQAVQQELGWGIFDQNECGASLAWKHFFPDEELPLVLQYVRDRDLWLWKLPHSKAITTGLFYHFSDDNFSTLLDANLDDMATTGTILISDQERRMRQSLANGRPTENPYGLMGVRAFVVNTAADISEIGERIYLPQDQGGMGYDLAICFSLNKKGEWVHSLRSETVHCARIAEGRNGGGHPSAAAYRSDAPFFDSSDCLDGY